MSPERAMEYVDENTIGVMVVSLYVLFWLLFSPPA
jgi:hypothetical protein